MNKILQRVFLGNTDTFVSCHDRRRLIQMEALLIKAEKPELISQADGSKRLLEFLVHESEAYISAYIISSV